MPLCLHLTHFHTETQQLFTSFGLSTKVLFNSFYKDFCVQTPWQIFPQQQCPRGTEWRQGFHPRQALWGKEGLKKTCTVIPGTEVKIPGTEVCRLPPGDTCIRHPMANFPSFCFWVSRWGKQTRNSYVNAGSLCAVLGKREGLCSATRTRWHLPGEAC